MKICSKCKQEQSHNMFSKAKYGKNGLSSRCKSCDARYRMDHKVEIKAWHASNYQDNREEYREQRKQYRDSHKLEALEYRKDWYANPENRKLHSDYNKLWYKANSCKSKQTVAEWKRANPEKVRQTNARRRATQKGATVSPMPSDIWELLLIFYGEHCMFPDCDKINLTLDHIVALDNGGSHSVDNFQILCGSHNSSKGNHHSTDYRPARKFKLCQITN